MWFDELQAWNIARASSSIQDLAKNIRHEGHPILWYALLYGVARITGDPRGMQAVQLLSIVGVYALILFRSPFRLALRVALCAGYLFTFEYAVISRGYGLSAFLLFAAVVALSRPRPSWRMATISLVLLAFCEIAGAILALAIASTIAITLLGDLRGGHGPARSNAAQGLRSAIVIAIGVGVATVSTIPPQDSAIGGGFGAAFASSWTTRVADAVGAIWRGLVPIPNLDGVWNSQILDGVPQVTSITTALSVIVAVAVLVALWKAPFARTLWATGLVGLLVLYTLGYPPAGARHIGFVMLLFIASAWCAWSIPMGPRLVGNGGALRSPGEIPRRQPIVVITWLVAGAAVVAATLSLSASIRRPFPFGPNREIAGAINRYGMADFIVSGDDSGATTIGALFDRDVYSVGRQRWIRFFVVDKRSLQMRRTITNGRVLRSARTLASCEQRPVAVALPHALRSTVASDLTSLQPDEIPAFQTWYRVEPSASSPDVRCTTLRRYSS